MGSRVNKILLKQPIVFGMDAATRVMHIFPPDPGEEFLHSICWLSKMRVNEVLKEGEKCSPIAVCKQCLRGFDLED